MEIFKSASNLPGSKKPFPNSALSVSLLKKHMVEGGRHFCTQRNRIIEATLENIKMAVFQYSGIED